MVGRRVDQSRLGVAAVALVMVVLCFSHPAANGHQTFAIPGGKHNRQRLDPTTTGDWESKVLGSGSYSGVLPHDQVPFVNRRSEIFDLFQVNAAVILKLLDCRCKEVHIRDWRPCGVAVAAQMFGSGKTTLGDNFIKQLKDEETKAFILGKLTGDDWKKELMRAQSAASWYYNLNCCESMYDVGIRLDFERFKDSPATTPDHIAQYIFAKVLEHPRPVFVHFDEIGDLQVNVKELREAVRRVWELMLKHDGDMPRIYFYLSGKSVPLTALGGEGSAVGTKWIILDLLQEEHIQEIVNAATSADTNLLCPSVAKIQGLSAALQQWTGGSPRLMVYSLRVLHHLLNEGKTFGSAEHAMEAVFEILKDQQAVAGEVFLAKKDETAFQQTWLYLILLAQLRVPCQRDTILPVGSAQHSLDLLLGRLNVYISKPEAPIEGMSDGFYICHMKMVDKFVRSRYTSDCRVQLFLGDEGTRAKAEDLLEHMVAQRIVVQACLHPHRTHVKWGDLMNPLLQETKADQLQAQLDQGCPLSSFPKVTKKARRLPQGTSSLTQQLHPDDLAAAIDQLDSGRLYRPRPMSSSADLFIKQPTLTIEVQDKSGVSTGVSFADVRKEVGKCIQQGSVLWVLVALKLDESLSHWVGEAKPLVLESGIYQEEKLAHGGSRGLLYRVESSGSWQKRIQNGEWQDVETEANPEGKGKELRVRQELQLVIPHPNHVKAFLGDSDFKIVEKLAKNPGDRKVDIPFLSRFYNFEQPPAQGTAPATSTAVWVQELIRKDKQLTAGSQQDFEPKGNAFQVKGALSNVDDLKKAIDPALSSFQASKIDIYSQTEDGRWVKEDEEAEVNRGTSKKDCYGFVLPSDDA